MIAALYFVLQWKCDQFNSLKASNRLVRERNFDNDG